jgi:peptidoglycan/xylan/chitin deacetylase (PgdA/CDA1 family)
VLRAFDHADFIGALEVFEAAGATASVAFLGRDADRQAETLTAVGERGHEVVCHGHRHVKFGDLSYETAHDDLSRALDAFEAAADVTPSGFFAPFKATSVATLEAAADLGFDWVLGVAAESDVPDGIRLVDSVYPHDTRLLEGGTPPEETFEQLADEAVDGSTFLFHPNMLEYYDAEAEFAAFVEAVGPTAVGEQVAAGEGVGVVLDCLRPLRIV